MWPDRRLCKLLGIEHPIIQAPMAGSATPDLAVAVSNAGGLGSLGCGELPDDSARAVTGQVRAGTNRPFNLNFFVYPEPVTDARTLARTRQRLGPWYKESGLDEPVDVLPEKRPGFDEAKLELVLELQPPVVSFHFGVPNAQAIRALKDAGITLLSTATTVDEARYLVYAGVDAVIAQGWEAGGHRGSHKPTAPMDGVGTFALVPQIVDAVDTPVIAAGGIGDGRGIAAAFALGACGVQIGTGYLLCPEADTDRPRRKLLSSAKDIDTLVTDAFSGRSARAVKSRYAEEMERTREPLAAFPSMYALSGPLLSAANDTDVSFHLYGQAAALSLALPAAELTRRLVDDALNTMKKLSKDC